MSGQKILSLILAVVLLLQQILPSAAQALPLEVETRVAQPHFLNLSEKFDPVHLRGLRFLLHNPLSMDFVVDLGSKGWDHNSLPQDVHVLTDYFLAALAIPEKELWVNLSPYEKARVVPQFLGQTRLGHDLLLQDKLLKQMVASLMSPDTVTGKKFWADVYHEIPDYDALSEKIDTFHKVWVVPDKAEVEENQTSVVIKDSHLRVMLEKDYLAVTKNKDATSNVISSQGKFSGIIEKKMRDIIIPALEVEVNTGKNFAPLRQIFQAAILAVWYKQAAREGWLGQIYANRSKVSGIGDFTSGDIDDIFTQYVQVYKEGVFNFIRDEENNVTGELMPRHYFSGGYRLDVSSVLETRQTDDPLVNYAQLSEQAGNSVLVESRIRLIGKKLSRLFNSVTLKTKKETPSDALNSRWIDRGALLALLVWGKIMSDTYSILMDASANFFSGLAFIAIGSITFNFVFGVATILSGVFLAASRSIASKEPISTALYTNTYSPLPAGQYPSMTIHIPVYLESLNDVLMPTFRNAVEEISAYRNVNPNANLVISDDGLNVMAVNDVVKFEEQALAKSSADRTEYENEVLLRLAFYRSLVDAGVPVTIVARAMPEQGKDFTLRAGRFKKASNLNTALLKIYDKTRNLMESEGLDLVAANKQVLASNEHQYTFVLGDPVIFHDVTMVLDNDSGFSVGISERVLTEFVHRPQLSYVQMATDPSNTDESSFTKTIGWMTKVQFHVTYKNNVLFGMMVPFVGHNGYIRTQALLDQQGWSERHVAEDYVFAMEEVARKGVQAGRYVDYPDMHFTEEVSSTLAFEMSKTFRYAFGAIEMFINRPSEWKTHGVFQKRFLSFVRSGNLSFGVKTALISWLSFYVGTSFMALAILLAPLLGSSLQLALVPFVFFTVVGNLSVWQSGLFHEGNNKVSIKNVVAGMYHSTLFGAVNMAVGSYYAFKAAVKYFLPGDRIFAPTAKAQFQALRMWDALRNIGAETHLRVLGIVGVFGTQIAIMSMLGLEFFTRAADFMNTSTIIFAVVFPYLLDVSLMSYLGKSIKAAIVPLSGKTGIQENNVDKDLSSNVSSETELLSSADPMVKTEVSVDDVSQTGGVDFSDWSVLKRTGTSSLGLWGGFNFKPVEGLEGIGFDFLKTSPFLSAQVSGGKG